MTKTDILLESGTNELEVLEFMIAKKDDQLQHFGINVAKVREVIRMPKYDDVPNAHPSVKGVFQLRESIIPLIDLSVFLNYKVDFPTNKAKVIVTEFNRQNFGFIVHDVVRIHRFSWEKVLSPDHIVNNAEKSSVVSLIKMDGFTLFMLDFEKIVTDVNPESGLRTSESAEILRTLNGRTYTVLLADDSSTIRDLVKGALTPAGFKITTVQNGKEAYDVLLSARKKVDEKVRITDFYDVVISDIEMPIMDGHALCKKIKEDPILRKLPVVLFSSLIYEELRKKGDAVGADAQVSKPDLKDLVEIVRDLVNHPIANNLSENIESDQAT